MSDTSGIAPVGVTPGNASADLSAAQNAGKAILGKASGPVGYGAGQNPFTAAANNVDAQKANILAVLAAGGSAGRAALDQANASIAAGRQAAIQAALSGSAARGVNAGLGNQLGAEQGAISGTVGAPGQQYGADLSAAGRDFTENNAFLQHGFDQYGQEARAAVPVIEANTQQSLQGRRMEALAKMASAYQAGVGRAQQSADSAAASQAIKNLDLQIAGQNANAATSRASAAAANAANRGTTGATGKNITITVDPGSPATAGVPRGPGTGSDKLSPTAQAILNSQPAPTAARPPTTVTVPNTPDGIRSTSGPNGYDSALTNASAGAQAGWSQSRIEATLLASGYAAPIVNQVMADINKNFTTNPNGGSRSGK